MRLLHTSDWHLGQYFYGKNRLKEHQLFLNWLLQTVEQHQIDALIVAGDVFDTNNPPSYARECYYNFVVDIAATGCQLIVVTGNHDSVAMHQETHTVLTRLGAKIIAKADDQLDEQVFTVKNRQGEHAAVVMAVPFIRPKDVQLSVAGESADNKQRQLTTLISEHYQQLYQRATVLAQNKLPIIATGHFTVVGATTSESVRDIYIGTLDALPSDLLPPVDYLALGHIHGKQKVAKQDHLRYCGSPIPLSFDEAKSDKVVLMVEFCVNQAAVVSEILVPRFQPLFAITCDFSSLPKKLDDIEAQLGADQTAWLSIEIKGSEHLTDIQARVAELAKDKPVEVLLVRRAHSTFNSSLTAADISLAELSVQDVFQQRLTGEQSEQSESSTEVKAKQQRLSVVFQQIADEVESELKQRLADEHHERDEVINELDNSSEQRS